MTIQSDALRLREREKARTRSEIRDQALRLFLLQGYEPTTVEQIADASEVSVSPRFHGFPATPRLVLTYDLEALVRDAIATSAPNDTVFDAIESALLATFEELAVLGHAANEPLAVSTVERARNAYLREVTGRLEAFATLIGARWGSDPHDPLVQAAAGSVVGIAIAAWSADRDLGRRDALRILHVGLQSLEAAFRP
jgi:AcrR family transcriptional regulator